MTNTKNDYYLLLEKPVRDRKFKIKHYIEKLMFVCAVYCPLWVAVTKDWFYGFI